MDTDYEDVSFVGDKLQYTNSGLPHPFTQYAYRPGVSLMRLPPEVELDVDNNPSLVQCVLVAQYLDGLKPPSNRLWMEQAAKEDIPLGKSRYYSLVSSNVTTSSNIEEGNPLQDSDDVEMVETVSPEDLTSEQQGLASSSIPRPMLLISKMKLEPLNGPTSILVATTNHNNEAVLNSSRECCRGMLEYGTVFLDRLEEELHNLLRRRPQTTTA
jgi:hypothetical protein